MRSQVRSPHLAKFNINAFLDPIFCVECESDIYFAVSPLLQIYQENVNVPKFHFSRAEFKANIAFILLYKTKNLMGPEGAIKD